MPIRTPEQQAHDLIAVSKNILCITGAGLSADSGLPTYRGIGGLYDSNNTEDDIPIEIALSGQMLAQRPELTWKYIGQIESGCRQAQPNAAHHAIAELEKSKQVTVLTQNVDGFHQQAGSSNVIEIHGNVQRLYCQSCDYRSQVPDYAELELPPSCPDCSGQIRPAVVLFGEMLPAEALDALDRSLSGDIDLVLSIGTTSVFPYIAGPVEWAARNGIATIEINPGDTEVSAIVDIRLQQRAAEVLPRII